jgi:indole-3-glycerol phosphate synthase
VMGPPVAHPPSAVYDIAALVPSQRDFLQAARTGREGLALVPCLSAVDAGREALRLAEAGVNALAMSEASLSMAEASRATRLPMLSLRLLRSRDEALAARAFGADAVIVDPTTAEDERKRIADSARSVRMMVLSLTTTREEVAREVQKGARAVVAKGPSVASIKEQLAGSPRLLVVAWLSSEEAGPAESSSLGRNPEDDLRALNGHVDAAIVGVELYGATGFERLVSELYP